MDFNNILIGSDQPERLIEYYTKLLGAPSYSDSSYSSWQIGRGYVAVGAHSEVHGKNAQPGRVIWNIETADVKEVLAKSDFSMPSSMRRPPSMTLVGSRGTTSRIRAKRTGTSRWEVPPRSPALGDNLRRRVREDSNHLR